jgi:RNA polymerase sigma-70 factor, ECF subfamily
MSLLLASTRTQMTAANDQLVEPSPISVVVRKHDVAELTDAALVQALTSRSPEAERLVWEKYSPIVRRLVQRTMGYGHDVEDVVQDAFVCLFKRVHTLREPTALKSFTMSIAMLTTKHELKRRRFRRLLGLAHASDVPDLRAVHDGDDSREALARFGRLLDRLRDRDRSAFALRFIEGMEVADIAGALGVSVPTVRRSLTRARQRVSLLVSRDPFLTDYLACLSGRAPA